jgi:hypothetical protein
MFRDRAITMMPVLTPRQWKRDTKEFRFVVHHGEQLRVLSVFDSEQSHNCFLPTNQTQNPKNITPRVKVKNTFFERSTLSLLSLESRSDASGDKLLVLLNLGLSSPPDANVMTKRFYSLT